MVGLSGFCIFIMVIVNGIQLMYVKYVGKKVILYRICNIRGLRLVFLVVDSKYIWWILFVCL